MAGTGTRRYVCPLALVAALVTLAGCAERLPPPPEDPGAYLNMRADPEGGYPARTVLLHNLRRLADPSLSPETRLESLRMVELLQTSVPNQRESIREVFEMVLTDPKTPPSLQSELRRLGWVPPAGGRYDVSVR
jgi:hypothetical protein